MIRTTLLALTATAAFVAPAFAGETAVKLDGRTQTEIRAEVRQIANRLCAEKLAPATSADLDACVAEAVSATMRRVSARGAYVYKAVSAD